LPLLLIRINKKDVHKTQCVSVTRCRT
jgi:hypothetical protein